jgi:hypothetical protein
LFISAARTFVRAFFAFSRGTGPERNLLLACRIINAYEAGLLVERDRLVLFFKAGRRSAEKPFAKTYNRAAERKKRR